MNKETSCINSKVIIDYIKEYNHGDCSALLENLDPEIDVLLDPEGFLKDPNNWISCAVISKLYKRAKSILHDERAPFKISRYAIEKTDLGFKSLIVRIFGSHHRVLKNVQRINAKWNKSKTVELVTLKRNEAVIRLHWNPQIDISGDLCLYNQGIYTFIPILWGGKPLTLEEKCCYFKGAPYCEYHLRWPSVSRLYDIFSRFFPARSVLMETAREIEKDKEMIEQKYEEVNQLNWELNQKIKQLLAIQETGKAILSVLDLKQLLSVVMNLISNVCHIHRAIIMLVNKDKEYLEYIHGMGFDGEAPDEVKNYRVSLDRVSNILVRVVNTGRSEYVPDVNSSNLRKENVILTHGNPVSVYVVPLIAKSKVIGVIATDAVDEDGVAEETRKTLEIFTPQIAMAIDNARLYSKLHEQMIELKQSHALLSRAEKFSFLGNIAARLAHEIKNPMTAIGTFIQLLPSKFDDEEFRKDFYEIAKEETKRINDLITELLDLVKTKESHFESTDLHDLINKMILLVSPQSNSKQINVLRNFDPDVGKVWMDSEKIKQVVLNLLSNAIDFTPRGGKI
ncbi:MAG: histidine kinase dimerization/phospho-acceptor domain-containing protein, partial [Thermodesulfobacteriota bacterium]|nr:histidine kinase dimerization/phospho-acceptor domain-containing protein [Thermodesulfobacteriota bacterium]